jgi:hypothetical protein
VFFRGNVIDAAGILLLCFAFGGSALVGRIVGYAAGKAWFRICVVFLFFGIFYFLAAHGIFLAGIGVGGAGEGRADDVHADCIFYFTLVPVRYIVFALGLGLRPSGLLDMLGRT